MNNSERDKLWRSLENSSLVRFLLLFGCGWALIQFINYFYSVLALFTAAAVLAALLNYPVHRLSRYLPRGWAIAIVFLAAVSLTLGFITLLGLEIISQGQGLVNSITDALQNSNLPFRAFLEDINFERIIAVLQSGLGTGLGIASGLFANTFTVIFVLVITVYMLIDGEKMWHFCLKLVPLKERDRFKVAFQRSFLGFFRAQILLVLFLSTLSFIVYSLLGIKFALILAVVVGILDAIPGIGATLGILIVTVLVFASQGFEMALKIVISSVILQQIQDNLIHPKLMGKALDINPIAIFFAIFVGEKIAGLLGIFLSIPITAMIVSWLKSQDVTEKSPSTNDQ